eukprot:scaffold6661_cov109-Cylindrotheca_fusiformis.AAC.4
MIGQQRTFLKSYFSLLLPLLLATSACQGLSLSSSPTATKSMEFPTISLQSTGKSQLAILDGGEWTTVQALLQKEGRLSQRTFTKYGYMKLVTGLNDQNQRVVGMQSGSKDNESVYQDSVAVIPDKVSEMDAIATYIASFAAIHCALPPNAKHIGGGTDSVSIEGKTVILGSSELACFAAEGLASLGVHVSLVSPGSPSVNKKVGKRKSCEILPKLTFLLFYSRKNSPVIAITTIVDVLKPAVGPEEIGFAAHVGDFDSLVDTLNNEMRSNRNFEDDDDYDDENFRIGGSTISLLKKNHNCQRYISTLTECQTIVAKEGIFGGPGKADAYAKEAGTKNSVSFNPDFLPIPPPEDIGSSMTKLLEKGVILSSQLRKKMYAKSDVVRGWSLSDFWENTRWPRDASADVRFGLPVLGEQEEEEEDERMISEAPSQKFEKVAVSSLLRAEALGVDTDEEAPQPKQTNPHVFDINGVSGMKSAIIDPGKDCILFLSAKFCKTCKHLTPKYTRLARIEKENDSPVLFARAEMGSAWGKKLGRVLQVDAVPSFVLFRNGKRFGSPLSVSDLPSKKIGRALALLESGKDWDPSVLKEE